MAAIICVTVVLPLLPVTAISGSVNWARHWVASCASASLVSGTSKPGRPRARNLASTSPPAPAALAWQMTATAPCALA